jgi:hypothetical protein
MSDNKPEEIEAEVKIEEHKIPLQFVRPPDFQLYFCNSMQISPGKSELQMFFGQIIPPPSGSAPEQLLVQQKFGIAITLEHAERVLVLLQQQLKASKKISVNPDVESP